MERISRQRVTVIQVKVPYRLLQKANEQGVGSDVEFYYQLKSLTPHGSFIKGTVVPIIQEKYGYSSASIWRKIRRLRELGWMRNNKLAYHLSSYDTIWKSLGYNLKRDKRGNLKFPLSRFVLTNFKSQCAQHDIHINLKKQTLHVRKNLQHAELRKDDYTAMQNCDTFDLRLKLDALGQKRPVDIVRAYERSIENANLEDALMKDVPRCNPDITLSCKGVAKLLGHESASTGHRIIKTLEQNKLIDVRRRVVCLGMKHPQIKAPSGPQYYLEGNMIMRQIPSMLYVNLES